MRQAMTPFLYNNNALTEFSLNFTTLLIFDHLSLLPNGCFVFRCHSFNRSIFIVPSVGNCEGTIFSNDIYQTNQISVKLFFDKYFNTNLTPISPFLF